MKKIYFLAIIIVFVFLSGNTYAQLTYTSVGNGDWTNPNTWNLIAVPTSSDNVIIAASSIVNINANAECKDISFANSTTSKIAFNTASTTLSIYGNITGVTTGDDYTSGTSATGTKIIFTGSASQSISNIGGSCNWPDFEVNKSAGTLTTNANTRIDGHLTVTAGTFDINANAISMASTSNITVAASASLINVGRVAQTTGGTAKNNSISISGIFSSSTVAASINTTTLTVNDGATLDMKGTATGFNNTSGSENPTTMTCNSGSTVKYSGTAATGRFVNYHHLILSGGTTAGSAIKTISAVGTITIGGDLTISNGARFLTGGNVVVSGTTNINDNGEILWNGGSTSTFIFNGAVNINGNSANGVIRFGGTYNLTPTYTFNGDVTVSANTTTSAFNLNSGTGTADNKTFEGVINFNGNVTLASTSSTFTSVSTTNPPSTNINFGGTDKTLSVLAGTSFINLRGDYTFKTNRTITSTSSTSFTFTSRPSSVTPEWTIKIDNGVTVTVSEGSSVSLPNRAFSDGTGAGNLQINGDLRIGLAGGWNSAVTNTGSLNLGTVSKVTFNGSVAQVTGTNLPVSLVNLVISNSTGVTLSGATNVSGTLTLSSGNLDNSANQITMGDASTISRATGTLSAAPVFAGLVNLIYTGAVTTGNELPTSSGILNNLTINIAAGVTLNNSATVNGSLSFSAGKLTTGLNTLTLGSFGIITEAAGRYLVGNLEVTRAVGIDQNSTFGGIGISLAAASEDLGNVTITRVTGSAVSLGDNTGIKRRWKINPQNPLTTARDITFSWISDDDNDKILTSVQTWKSTDDFATIPNTSAIGGIQDASTSREVLVTVNSLSSGSNTSFTVSQSDQPLPVELSSFTAITKGQNALLTWETKTETDNSGFEVERKDKNGDWTKIGFIEGFGTSNSPKYYAFEDKKLSSGKHNYRLKQLDNDGTTSYSDEVEVTIDVPTEFALSQNYPNPFNPSTKVDYQLAMDAKVTIELYSITGEKVATLLSQELEAGYYSMMIDSYTHGMASGIYIYRMIATDALGKSFVSTKKLSLIK